MNKYIIKANNFYLKALRRCEAIQYFEYDNAYWLTNGYIVHKIPAKMMELNPFLIKEATQELKDIIIEMLNVKNTKLAKETGLQRKIGIKLANGFLIDEINEPIWFNSELLKLFPDYSKIYATEPLKPALVKRNDEILGIVLPLQCIKNYDIKLFI